MSGAYYNENDPKAAAWLRELIKAGHIAPGEVDERSIVDVKADDLKGFTQCHFFAGIAIWSAAFRLAGWPDDRPVWSGSAPCQGYSVAGKGKGTDDDRDLWPVFASLIRECRPEYVFGEQVEAAIAYGWLDRLRLDLEKETYAVGSCVLGAHSSGAPHIRQRLWWVADNQEHGRRATEPPARSGEEHGGVGNAVERGERRGDQSRPRASREQVAQPQDRESATDQSCDGRDELGGLENTSGTRPRYKDGSSSEQERNPMDAGAKSIRQVYRSAGTDRTDADGGGSGMADMQRERGRNGNREGQDAEDAEPCRFNLWLESKLHHCRDGKSRCIPTESGLQSVVDDGAGLCTEMDAGWNGSLFPLAGKMPGRVMLLRGAGNAVNMGTCAAFIEAADQAPPPCTLQTQIEA